MTIVSDPFFRKMLPKLEEELNDRVNNLARGSALVIGERVGIDIANTAMNYQKSIAYIEALQNVIELGCEMDRDQYGHRSKNSIDGDD
jgi:hypothetical protein